MDLIYSASDLILLSIVIVAAFSTIQAMISDFKEFIIPNSASLLIIASFLGFKMVELNIGQTSWQEIGYSLIIAMVIFTISFLIYYFGQFGAGDVKFLSALSLWAGTTYMMDLLLIMAMSGGVLALFIMLKSRHKEHTEPSNSHIANSQVEQRVPYGIAIGLGGLYVLAMYLTHLF